MKKREQPPYIASMLVSLKRSTSRELTDPIIFLKRISELQSKGLSEGRIAQYFGLTMVEYRKRIHLAYKIKKNHKEEIKQ